MAELIADLEPLGGGAFAQSSPTMHKSETAKDPSPVAQPSVTRDGWRDWRLLTAAGAGGLLLVLLSVWVIIRDKDGREVARIQAPAGGTVNIETPTESDDERRLKWHLRGRLCGRVARRGREWGVQFVAFSLDFERRRNPGSVPRFAKILPACRARVLGKLAT